MEERGKPPGRGYFKEADVLNDRLDTANQKWGWNTAEMQMHESGVGVLSFSGTGTVSPSQETRGNLSGNGAWTEDRRPKWQLGVSDVLQPTPDIGNACILTASDVQRGCAPIFGNRS